MSEQDLAAAKRDAEAAKARLLGTAHELQERLTAKNLAETAFDALRDKGQAAAQGAARAVRSRPVAASAAAVGLVALVACKPIAALIGRFRNNHSSNGDER
jgi:hypothetical protein